MISIGIPTYNQADTLGATIESFLNQSVKPLEIVVSENWCTDHTQKVLNKFEGKIKVVRPERHLSMMENWNFLVDHLRGEWFSLMSSDDLALPNFVSDIFQSISENEDAVLVRGPYIIIDSNGDEVDRRTARYAAKKRDFPANFYEQIFGTKTSFSAFSVKKRAFITAGRFEEKLTYSGDYHLWLSLSVLGSFITVAEPVSKYRYDYRPDIYSKRFNSLITDNEFIRSKTILGIYNNWVVKLINGIAVTNSIREIKKNAPDLDDQMVKKTLSSLYKFKNNWVYDIAGYVLNKVYRLRTIK